MANFRNIALTNYAGAQDSRIELNDFNGYLVTSPTGLGIYATNSFLTVGNKRIRTGQSKTFESIRLVVDIYGNTRPEIEAKYANLRDFLAKNSADGFRLYYKPYDDGQERYIICDIRAFEKGEKMGRAYMSVPLTVEPRTLWLVDTKSVGTERDTTTASNFFTFGDGVTDDYAAIFDYDEDTDTYNIAFVTGTTVRAELNNDGDVEIPLKIRIFGQAVNPYVRLFPVGGAEAVQDARFNITVPMNSYIEVNSDVEEANAFIVYQVSGVVASVMDYADQTTTIYIRLPRGKYELVVTDTIGDDIGCEVYYARQFLGA